MYHDNNFIFYSRCNFGNNGRIRDFFLLHISKELERNAWSYFWNFKISAIKVLFS